MKLTKLISKWLGALFLVGSLAMVMACDEAEPEAQATAEDPAAAKPVAADEGEAAEKADEGLGDRIVIAGGTLTEVVYALGAGDRVVAVDTSSVYPQEATELPKIGFFRKLAAEPIIATKPSVILITEGAGPDTAIEQLESTEVRVEKISDEETVDAAIARIEKLGELLAKTDEAKKLVEKLEADLEKVASNTKEAKASPSVLFVYARGPNVTMVTGKETGADKMLALAGAKNAVREFEGFKPLTAEAVVAAKPDVIVMPTKSAKSLGGWEGISKLPGIAETPAAKSRQLVTVDDLALLGFGPRMGEALLELQQKLLEETADGID